MSKLAVIIVNWNTGRLVRDCVASLVHLPEHDLIADIIVVDSASSDNSIAQLEEWLTTQSADTVSIFKQPRNIGFARSNNVGIRHLQKKYQENLPHILFLNPDTIVTSGTIPKLLDELVHQRHAGIIGPTLHNADGTLQPSVRRFPTLLVLLTFLLKSPRLVRRARFWQQYLADDFNYQRAQDVDQIMGAAFLVRRELLLPKHPRAVGLWDERFFVWWEEVDYCRRAQAAGWRVRYVPTPGLRHFGGVSFAQLVGLRRTLPWVMSLLRYTHKHMGVFAATLVLALLPLNMLLAFPAAVMHRRNQSAV